MKSITDPTEAEQYRQRLLATASNDLERAYYSHQGKAIFKWHHYLEAYDRYLSPWRGRPARVLELGVLHGGSLELWREYLGAEATIFGIDIDARCAAFSGEGGQVRIGSQDDKRFLRKVVKEMGGVDIVIDDGSHIASHQRASFKHLFGEVTEGGLYVVEDLHTSYWDGWEGGLRRDGTFIESVKVMIDHMHEWYVGGVSSEFGSLKLKHTLGSVHMFDSMAVFEKRARSEPMAVQIGNSSLG